VLKLKQSGKASSSDLISLPICHPHKLLCTSIKVESGIKLTDDFLVLIILEAHHLGHLQLITCGLDLIEYCMPLCCHPSPIYPLSLHHGRLLVEIDRLVPIQVEKRPKTRVAVLFVAIKDRIFTIFVDGGLLQFLGVAGGQVRGPLNRSVMLKHLTFFFLFPA
jgi:hypothetical protein